MTSLRARVVERWTSLSDTVLGPRGDPIEIDAPADVALERLRRATQPRTWIETVFRATEGILYGAISAGRVDVEMVFDPDSDARTTRRFVGRLIPSPGGSRLEGRYGRPFVADAASFLVAMAIALAWIGPSAVVLVVGAIYVGGFAVQRLPPRVLDSNCEVLRHCIRRELSRP